MNTVTRLSAVLAATLSIWLPVARSAGESSAPAAARFYVLTGDWQGEGSVSESGKVSRFDLRLQCSQASAGWAELCMLIGRDRAGDAVLAETDLFGVDPLTGQGHWYAVTNSGETHDHLADWTDALTLHAHLNWRQEGKRMEERIVISLAAAKTLEFHSVVSEDGHNVSEFTGTLHGGS
jgi:hypothetical protein